MSEAYFKNPNSHCCLCFNSIPPTEAVNSVCSEDFINWTREHFKVNIRGDNGLPRKVCVKCIRNVVDYCRFHDIVQSNQQHLAIYKRVVEHQQSQIVDETCISINDSTLDSTVIQSSSQPPAPPADPVIAGNNQRDNDDLAITQISFVDLAESLPAETDAIAPNLNANVRTENAPDSTTSTANHSTNKNQPPLITVTVVTGGHRPSVAQPNVRAGGQLGGVNQPIPMSECPPTRSAPTVHSTSAPPPIQQPKNYRKVNHRTSRYAPSTRVPLRTRSRSVSEKK